MNQIAKRNCPLSFPFLFLYSIPTAANPARAPKNGTPVWAAPALLVELLLTWAAALEEELATEATADLTELASEEEADWAAGADLVPMLVVALAAPDPMDESADDALLAMAEEALERDDIVMPVMVWAATMAGRMKMVKRILKWYSLWCYGAMVLWCLCWYCCRGRDCWNWLQMENERLVLNLKKRYRRQMRRR